AAHGRVGEIDREVVAGNADFAPGCLREQAGEVRRNDIDYMLLKSFALADRGAVANRLLDPILVAIALLRDAAGEADGEVLDLFTHRAADVRSPLLHWMRGADRCARRHRRDIRGLGDERPRRRGAGT